MSRREKPDAVIRIAMRSMLFALVPIIGFYLMEFLDRNPFEQIRAEAHWFNILIYELLAWGLFALIGRARAALRIVLAGTLFVGLVNHYVMAFRSTPFVPWDIYSIRVAASVASGYDFTMPGRVAVVIAGFVLLMGAVHFLNWRLPGHYLCRGLVSVALFGVLMLFNLTLQQDSFQTAHHLYPFLFTPGVMVKYNGFAVTFAMDLKYLVAEKPAGYSKTAAETLLKQYSDRQDMDLGMDLSEGNSAADYPNIIVIMDEAFSDLSVLGTLETDRDFMPFFHSLEDAEDTVTGWLNVSVCGGNTADSEFEFLTGNTMAFLPNGSIPYQQYIRGEIPSLARDLSELGYATYAQHPYYASGWERDKVYPWMGFEELSFLPDYQNRQLIRSYVSDRSSFNKIIETFENKPADTPAFIFNVTMQNHGGYGEEATDLPVNVHLQEIDSDLLAQYLNLIYLTDQELEALVDYFDGVEEKTILVFFGDHQPADAVVRQIAADPNQELRYKVPFAIRANFDIEEEHNVETSLNYLASRLLKLADLPMSDYRSFLLALQEEVPVISGLQIPEETASVKDYRMLQYYQMFDWSNDHENRTND